jgi:hypothetical protein
MATGLDVAEPQVLIQNPGGAAFPWTHVVLLRRLQEARWLALKPAGIVDTVDLTALRIIAIGRRATFPDAVIGLVGEFDTAPSAGALSLFHAQAVQTAGLLGGAAATSSTGRPGESWRVCHTGNVLFGEVVPDDVVGNSGTGAIRGSMALTFVDEQWLPVGRVPDAELAAWMSYMRTGPGRDSRVAGDSVDAAGRRHCSLHDYLGMVKPVDRKEQKDYPHRGPSAMTEVLQGVRASGKELIPYDEHWASNSGIHPGSAIRHEHRTIFHTFALLQSWDQVDLANLAGAEYLARRGIQIQRAVRNNPKAPSFVGLHRMLEHSLDETGGLATTDFTQHFATIAEADARVLKQNRLFRQELEQAPAPRQQGGGDDDGKGKKKGDKDNKKKKDTEDA